MNDLPRFLEEIKREKCEKLFNYDYYKNDHIITAIKIIFTNNDNDYFDYWLNKVPESVVYQWFKDNLEVECNLVRENPHQLRKIIKFLPADKLKKIITFYSGEFGQISDWEEIFNAKNFDLMDYREVKDSSDLDLMQSIFAFREFHDIVPRPEGRIPLIKLLLRLDIFKKAFYGEGFTNIEVDYLDKQDAQFNSLSDDYGQSYRELYLRNNFLFGYIEFPELLSSFIKETGLNINHLNKDNNNVINYLLEESSWLSYFVNMDKEKVVDYFIRLIDLGVDINAKNKSGNSFYDNLKRMDYLTKTKKLNFYTAHYDDIARDYDKREMNIIYFFMIIKNGPEVLQKLLSACEKKSISQNINKSFFSKNNKL